MTHSAVSCNIADRAGDDYKFSTVMLPVLAMLLMSLLGEKPLGEKLICKGQPHITGHYLPASGHSFLACHCETQWYRSDIH